MVTYRTVGTTTASTSYSTSASTSSGDTVWFDVSPEPIEWQPRVQARRLYDDSVEMRVRYEARGDHGLSQEEYIRHQQQVQQMAMQQNTWQQWTTSANNTYTSTSAATSDENGITWRVWIDEAARYEQELVGQVPPKETEADKRANKLLLSTLSKSQREEYEAHKCVTVKVSDVKRLRFKPGRVKNIEELDANGNVVALLCVHVEDYVPNEDNMLAQLLFAETDPDRFFAMANRYPRS